MFVNKISGVSNIGFKGIDYVKNNVGENLTVFNYPYDPETYAKCKLEIYKVKTTDRYNYKLSPSPIGIFELKPEGIALNLQNVANLDSGESFAYRYVLEDKNGNVTTIADTGNKIKPQGEEYVNRIHLDKAWKDGAEIDDFGDSISNYTHTLVTRKGTIPVSGGAGYLIMPDSYIPEARFRGFNEENTGGIYIDKNIQNQQKGKQKTFATSYGGNIAGIIYGLHELTKNGIDTLFLTPIANGDNVSGHIYWNKNNNQVSESMGNKENFNKFTRELFKNNMRYVFDGTFTSAGLESIDFQYALRWANKNPQTYYWFRMSGLKNQSLGLGVVPENKENLRHRVINAPYNYELKSNGTYKKVANSNYNPNKETLFQIYDASMVTESQLSRLDTPIRVYENLKDQANLDINSHEDTLISYVFQIDPKEYDARVDVINDLNKNSKQDIKLDSPEGTIMVSQFSNFRIDKKTEGGFVTWDANTDMAKKNYYLSGYDEKNLQSIVNESQRYNEQQMMVRGTKEVQDMTLQSARYWTEHVKNIQTLYAAQQIGTVKSIEGLNKLVSAGKLPKLPIGSEIDNQTLSNILNAQYLLEPKGVLDKDSVTIKAMMKLPLDSLELGENVQGVLTTSYFSNRATTDETVGKTRFELFKENNPHLVDDYAKVYSKVNALYTENLKDFANSVIAKVNENSNEKLLDSNGNYTEYGEYVMDLIGSDIVRYALLKSLSGDKFRVKIDSDNELTYDYKAIKNATSLKALGINANNPEEEAMMLYNSIKKGLNKLSQNDIDIVAKAINQRIAGTDTSSFRLAEAYVDRMKKGLSWRIDAAKDIMDQDAVRNRDDNFDDTWNELIKFYKKFVQTVKEQNPYSYIVAEMTDVPDLMRDTTGLNSCPYNGETNIGQIFNGEPDAFAKFYNETGITSEAGYSYFFTNLLNVFSNEFETGKGASNTHDSFKNRLDLLLQTRNIDYLRNLYTFMGNHDKPRMIHGMAVDMSLFHSPIMHNYDRYSNPDEFNRIHNHRMDVIRVLSGARTMTDVPIELRLNVDNNEYFRTISSRAIAQSKLLMDSVYEDLNGIASNEDIKLIARALGDLADGNFLNNKVSEKYTRISIPQLSSIENASTEILKLAENHGLHLTEFQKKDLINRIVDQVNKTDLADYSVYGDFDWVDFGIGEKHKAHMRELMGNDSYASSTDLYVMQLARLINDSYTQINGNSDAIKNAAKDFVIKYNKDIVNKSRQSAKYYETKQLAMKKNGYASRDFIAAMELAIQQAEFKSGKKIANKDKIIATVFRSVTEPAVQKSAMIMEFLKGLVGIPTMYAGDELGMTGYEDKAKNIYLQNRLLLPLSDLEKSDLIGTYRKEIYRLMTETLKDRTNPDLSALNSGTPYSMDVMINSRTRDEVRARIVEIDKQLSAENNEKYKAQLIKERKELVKSLACIALMRQSANGTDITVSLFNASGVNADNRHNYFDDEDRHFSSEKERRDYFEKNNIISINPNNKYVPILPKSEVDYIVLGAGVTLPVGMIFVNSNTIDKTRYIVQKLSDGKRVIAKEGGGKIIMDGITSKNGVMILRNLARKIAFRGKQQAFYNEKFNIVSNPYKKQHDVESGKQLSLISR